METKKIGNVLTACEYDEISTIRREARGEQFGGAPQFQLSNIKEELEDFIKHVSSVITNQKEQIKRIQEKIDTATVIVKKVEKAREEGIDDK